MTPTLSSHKNGNPSPHPPPAPAPGPALFIELDVHNDSIAVSIAPSDSTDVRRYGIIGGTHDDVAQVEQEARHRASGRGVALLLQGRAARVTERMQLKMGARK